MGRTDRGIMQSLEEGKNVRICHEGGREGGREQHGRKLEECGQGGGNRDEHMVNISASHVSIVSHIHTHTHSHTQTHSLMTDLIFH